MRTQNIVDIPPRRTDKFHYSKQLYKQVIL